MIEFDHALRLVPIIFVGAALVIGLPLAILSALALIRLFRRRVGRAMRSAAAGAVDTATGQAARPSPSTLPREELEIERMRADGKLARTGSTPHVLADALGQRYDHFHERRPLASPAVGTDHDYEETAALFAASSTNVGSVVRYI